MTIDLLWKCKELDVRLNSKYLIRYHKVKNLSHVITSDGVKLDPEKIKVISLCQDFLEHFRILTRMLLCQDIHFFS